MVPPVQYNFIDILWSPVQALSAKRIAAMTLFLLAALAAYDVFAYLALAVDGQSVGYVFSVYGFFYFSTAYSHVFAQIIFALGLALAVWVVMLGFFAVSATEVEEIRGNRFFSWRQAVAFALRRRWQIFLSELAIVMFLAFVVALFFVFGLVTRIPLLGEWLFVLLFILPNFVIAFFVVIIALVLAISVPLLPAVAAAERHGEVFNSLLETFSTVIRQPARWVVYTAYAAVAGKLCGFVYAYFSYRAVQFIVLTTSLGGGEKVRRLAGAAMSHLPVRSDLVRATCNIFPGIDWAFSPSRWVWGESDSAASYFLAAMLFVIFTSVIGYMLAVMATAQARAYAAIRYFKDGYKISDEKPLFFTDEHVNPPVAGDGAGAKVE